MKKRWLLQFLFLLLLSNIKIYGQDTEAPKLIKLSLSKDTINISNSDDSLNFELRITDNISGLERIYIDLAATKGTSRVFTTPTKISGNNLDGIWTGTFIIPKGSADSIWEIGSIQIRDNLGNQKNYSNTDFIQLKFDYQVYSSYKKSILQTSGILSQNLVINKLNSPYKLTGDLQIPENLSLTINEGVIFDGSGYSIKTKGNITATGAKGNPIQIKNLTIYGLSGLPTLDFNYCIISNSNLTKPTGNSDNPKQLIIKNSYYNTENKFSGNDATIYIYQFPTLIQNNIFENSPTIVNTFVKSGENVIIKNNNFISWPTNIYYKGLITLNVFDSSKYQISGNCFTDTNKIAATYESTFFSKEFTIKNNFWGTNNVNTIDKMIYDKKDNVSYLDLKYSPFLSTCPVETPKFITPKVKKRQYDIQLLSKPPQKDFIIGGIESINIDSSLFNFLSVKLKNKADSQFVYLNNNNILIKDSTRFNKVNNPLKIYLELDNGNSINTDSITINTICPILSKPILQPISQSKIFPYCEGDTLKLNVSSGTINKGDTLKWYLDNKLVGNYNPSGILTSFNFTDSGKLFVIKSDSLGCKISSDTVSLIKNPKPSPPQLIRDSANNLVSNYETNIWALNGNPLSQFNWPGINVKFIKPTASGDYTVSTVQKGCYSLKSSYYFLVTDVINLSANEFIKLAPNPFINQLNLDFVIKGYQRLNLEVFDLATGIRKSSMQKLTPGMPIYLGQLSTGTYYIRVSSKNGKINYQFKMIKL